MKSFIFWMFVCFVSATCNAASVHCDFNNDGFDDLAIGVDHEHINGQPAAGAVQVMYGRATGLSVTNNQFWHRDSPNVLGDAHESDNFGFSVACGDFNGDHFADLAIGAPNSTVSGIPQAGSVTVLYGTSMRLRGTNNQLWSQDSPGILDSPEVTAFAGESFGHSLASGDFNGDGYEDLAIGVVHENLEGETVIEGAGAVHVIYGSANGLTAAGNHLWTQNSAGILDTAERGEGFGSALVAANFGKDTATDCYDDLAIGVPGEGVTVSDNPEGAVNVLYGSAQGLSATGNQFWHEDSPGILGTAGSQDMFGTSLAAAESGGVPSQCGATTIADLVIGAPAKTVDSNQVAGAAFVIYGTESGLTATGNQIWHQNSPGIAETPEGVDTFGHAISAGHTDVGDYIVISAPGESVGAIGNGGVIHILFRDASTGKFTATGSKLFHQNTPGIKDTVESPDRFGMSVATGDFNSDGQDDIAVGVPFEAVGTKLSAGAVNILYSADTAFTQFFHQNSIDMKDVAEGGDSFGFSLAD